MRAVTFNILHGALGLGRVARVLEALAPDVVFLQEVDRRCERSGRVDQAASLAQALGMDAAFARALDMEGGEYGVALLSRRPLEDAATLALPTRGPRHDDGRGEPRVLLRARAGGLVLACTHLGLDPAERVAQAQTIRACLEGEEPLLLGGDFNEGPGGRALAVLEPRLHDAFVLAGGREERSSPPDRPDARIDFILATPGVPAARAAFVGTAGASDHRPVVVDFG